MSLSRPIRLARYSEKSTYAYRYFFLIMNREQQTISTKIFPRIEKRIRAIFTLDLRALALFRI